MITNAIGKAQSEDESDYSLQEVYRRRFTSERPFAWIDKFRALLLRFDRREVYFLGAHFIAFTLINLRHVLQL